jgi:hypothetical protein
MTKKELTILEYVRQDIRDVREDISDLHEKFNNHANGNCGTQRELTEYKEKHDVTHKDMKEDKKFNITTVIACFALVVSIGIFLLTWKMLNQNQEDNNQNSVFNQFSTNITRLANKSNQTIRGNI